jgi:pilus assembly protein CpaF
MKTSAGLRLLDRAFAHDELADLDPAARRLALSALFAEELEGVELTEAVSFVADEIDGYGRLTHLMDDDEVTDIVINGARDVWIDRGGEMVRTEVAFDGRDELTSFADRLMGRAGGRVDVSRPIADAQLPDGSRIHVVLPPIAPSGPAISIRRFPRVRFSLADLAERDLLTLGQAESLRASVVERRTIAISGGTGTGKTTLLNALLGEVPATERVVLIEETRELAPSCAHFVSLVSRSSNAEDAGRVTQADLVRAALRMRPDRIVVGEVRGSEALVALGAMSTGHAGSLVSIHARSAADVPDRFVALAMQADAGRSGESVKRAVADSLDIVVHLERVGRTRRVSEIVEM